MTLSHPVKLLFIFVCLQGALYAQAQDRVIEKLSWRAEPIKIQKLETRGLPIEMGKKFAEDDDWLDGLKVTVKNTSDKVITRIVMGLTFPRPSGNSEETTYLVEMMYGNDPTDENFDVLKQVNPGATAEVKMIKSNVPIIKQDLRQLGYPDPVLRAQLKIQSVTFIDGSMWQGDTIFYPDPKNPRNKMNPRHPMKSGPNPPTMLRSPRVTEITPRLMFAMNVPVNYVTTPRRTKLVSHFDLLVPCRRLSPDVLGSQPPFNSRD